MHHGRLPGARREPPLVLVGTLLILVGSVWIFQGAGLIGGSFMTRSSPWLVIGVVCDLVGIAAAVRGLRRRG